MYDLAVIMGMDPSKIIADVHPSLLDGLSGRQSKNISDNILEKLKSTVQHLKEEKQMRMEKVILLPNLFTLTCDFPND